MKRAAHDRCARRLPARQCFCARRIANWMHDDLLATKTNQSQSVVSGPAAGSVIGPATSGRFLASRSAAAVRCRIVGFDNAGNSCRPGRAQGATVNFFTVRYRLSSFFPTSRVAAKLEVEATGSLLAKVAFETRSLLIEHGFSRRSVNRAVHRAMREHYPLAIPFLINFFVPTGEPVGIGAL